MIICIKSSQHFPVGNLFFVILLLSFHDFSMNCLNFKSENINFLLHNFSTMHLRSSWGCQSSYFYLNFQFLCLKVLSILENLGFSFKSYNSFTFIGQLQKPSAVFIRFSLFFQNKNIKVASIEFRIFFSLFFIRKDKKAKLHFNIQN